MSDKTRDIIVGSIEEDIEIVKSLIEDTKKSLISNTELSQYRKSNRTIAYKATEHLLSDYTRQKQINEEHQKINGELRERVKALEQEIEKINKQLDLDYVEENYIPTQVLIDKIEELKKLKTALPVEHLKEAQIKILQELLGGER